MTRQYRCQHEAGDHHQQTVVAAGARRAAGVRLVSSTSSDVAGRADAHTDQGEGDDGERDAAMVLRLISAVAREAVKPPATGAPCPR